MPGCTICGTSTPRPVLLAGVPVHVVAARLGHADPSITLRVYAHVISDQLTEAADIFARAIAAPARTALLATALAKRPLPLREEASDLGALGGTRTPNLLIRSPGQRRSADIRFYQAAGLEHGRKPRIEPDHARRCSHRCGHFRAGCRR